MNQQQRDRSFEQGVIAGLVMGLVVGLLLGLMAIDVLNLIFY